MRSVAIGGRRFPDFRPLGLEWGDPDVVGLLRRGTLADRFGPKPIIISGWLYYALIYLGFGLVNSRGPAIFFFLAYGLYYGLCEPSEKAFIGDLAPKSLRGTAFGYYYLVTGLGALPASLLFGYVGGHWGYHIAFRLGAAFAGLASLLLFFVRRSGKTALRAA